MLSPFASLCLIHLKNFVDSRDVPELLAQILELELADFNDKVSIQCNDVVNKFKPQEGVTSEDERVAYLYLYMMLICAPICTSSGAILYCYEMVSLNCLPASY